MVNGVLKAAHPYVEQWLQRAIDSSITTVACCLNNAVHKVTVLLNPFTIWCS